MRHKLKNYSLFTQAVQCTQCIDCRKVVCVPLLSVYLVKAGVAPGGCAIVHERAPKYFTHLRPYLVVLHRFTEFLLALRRACRFLPQPASSNRLV